MWWNLPIQVILFCVTLSNLSEAINVKQIHPSAVVVGTVYCDTCFQDDLSRSSHFISGALVSVECESAGFRIQAKTDKKGEFEVHLPFSISKHKKEIKGCQVRLVKSSEPHCAVAATSAASSIHLKSRNPAGTPIFSAGFFTFKPLKQPDLCKQQPSITKFNTKKSLSGPDERPKQTRAIMEKQSVSSKESITRPQFFFPPIFPSPPPAISIPLPPNPLQPPPLVPLPPNPLQPPSPPPFGLPGIPHLPPFGIPSVPGLPGLTPSPPPPPPALPIPFPPVLPLPPIIPGVPPAKKVSP